MQPGQGDVIPELQQLLAEARRLGFVAGGPAREHLAHAQGFLNTTGGPPAGPALDLGSGAGLPGLPMALAWPESRWVLLDANRRRTEFLRQAVRRLHLDARVSVVAGRAEVVARDAGFRSTFALVVARSFGAPAVTAECAAGFLQVGGRLVVSEPPEPYDRWPAAGLAMLGLRGVEAAGDATGAHYQIMEQVAECPERYPRRVGIPTKRPLF